MAVEVHSPFHVYVVGSFMIGLAATQGNLYNLTSMTDKDIFQLC